MTRRALHFCGVWCGHAIWVTLSIYSSIDSHSPIATDENGGFHPRWRGLVRSRRLRDMVAMSVADAVRLKEATEHTRRGGRRWWKEVVQ